MRRQNLIAPLFLPAFGEHTSLSLPLSLTAVGCSHITQYQELTLLREFEKKEKTFTSRYQTKRKESRDMETKVGVLSACQSQLHWCILTDPWTGSQIEAVGEESGSATGTGEDTHVAVHGEGGRRQQVQGLPPEGRSISFLLTS